MDDWKALRRAGNEAYDDGRMVDACEAYGRALEALAREDEEEDAGDVRVEGEQSDGAREEGNV